MTFHLPKELERFVKDEVRAGRYAHPNDVIRDALTRLKEATSGETKAALNIDAVQSNEEKQLVDALNQRLLAAGLVLQLPDPSQDIDDDDSEDQPVEIEGEPLSETITRERR